jgi:hypothetical protein
MSSIPVEEIFNALTEENISEAKKYIDSIGIPLAYFNSLGIIDVLLYVIDQNLNYETTKFVIDECQYDTLDYTFKNPGIGTETPLISALTNCNREIADLLIKNGASINYLINSLSLMHYLEGYNILPKKILKYLINKSFNLQKIDSFLINSFESEILKKLFKYAIFDNAFIFKILTIYKQKEPLSDKQLKNIIANEKNKITIENDWYMKAIDNENYEAIEILYNNENKDNEKTNRTKLLTLFDLYDKMHQTRRKHEFIEKIINKNINIPMEESFLENGIMESLDDIKEHLIEIFKKGDKELLENYIDNTTLELEEINDENFDILMNAIENSDSCELIQYIIDTVPYTDLNYDLPLNKEYKTPISTAISYNHFKVADFLISKGADLNYKLVNDNTKSSNEILLYLYRNNFLNFDNLKYTLNKKILNKIKENAKGLYVTHSLIYNLIKQTENEMTEYIIRTLHFPVTINQYRVALIANNYDMVDLLYEIDKSEEISKLLKLIEALTKCSTEKSYLLSKKTKYDKIKSAADMHFQNEKERQAQLSKAKLSSIKNYVEDM